jgi:hypothetical protein
LPGSKVLLLLVPKKKNTEGRKKKKERKTQKDWVQKAAVQNCANSSNCHKKRKVEA